MPPEEDLLTTYGYHDASGLSPSLIQRTPRTARDLLSKTDCVPGNAEYNA